MRTETKDGFTADLPGEPSMTFVAVEVAVRPSNRLAGYGGKAVLDYMYSFTGLMIRKYITDNTHYLLWGFELSNVTDRFGRQEG